MTTDLLASAYGKMMVALDDMRDREVVATVSALAPYGVTFKIGLELIVSMGAPQVVKLVREYGGRSIFLDGKFNDIKTTIALASKAASELGVEFFNVHASSGPEGLKEAVNNAGKSKVLGVTVLTTFSSDVCVSIFGDKPKEKVLEFAHDLFDAGFDGIICSPQEIAFIREAKLDLLIVTPGVRPSWALADDQKRVMTPGEAVKAGADYLVIGRPITKPPVEIGDTVKAVQLIAEEIVQALAG